MTSQSNNDLIQERKKFIVYTHGYKALYYAMRPASLIIESFINELLKIAKQPCDNYGQLYRHTINNDPNARRAALQIKEEHQDAFIIDRFLLNQTASRVTQLLANAFRDTDIDKLLKIGLENLDETIEITENAADIFLRELAVSIDVCSTMPNKFIRHLGNEALDGLAVFSEHNDYFAVSKKALTNTAFNLMGKIASNFLKVYKVFGVYELTPSDISAHVRRNIKVIYSKDDSIQYIKSIVPKISIDISADDYYTYTSCIYSVFVPTFSHFAQSDSI